MGKGNSDYVGLSCLNDVLLVEVITINLISISQFSDQHLCVNFNQYEYTFTNKNHVQLMKGIQFLYVNFLREESASVVFDLQD